MGKHEIIHHAVFVRAELGGGGIYSQNALFGVGHGLFTCDFLVALVFLLQLRDFGGRRVVRLLGGIGVPIYGIADSDIFLGDVDFERDFSGFKSGVDSVLFLGVFVKVGMVTCHFLGKFLGRVIVSLNGCDRLGGQRCGLIVCIGYFISHFVESFRHGLGAGVSALCDFCGRILAD